MEYIQSLGELWQGLVDNEIKSSNENYNRDLAKSNGKEDEIETPISTLKDDEEEYGFEDNNENEDDDAELTNS